jgi:hypothetical protein
LEVVEIYIEMCWTIFPVNPYCKHVRAKAGVSSFAEMVICELAEFCHALDLELLKQSWNKAQSIGSCLTTSKMEIFLLALQLKAPERPNIDYIWQLNEHYGKLW